MLCFDAYTEDEVPDKSQEKYRIRHYKILFYLEDDTIQVNEPQLKNCGLPQGTCLKQSYGSLTCSSYLYILPFSSFLKGAIYHLGV